MREDFVDETPSLSADELLALPFALERLRSKSD